MKVTVEGPDNKLLKMVKAFRSYGLTVTSEDGTVLAAPNAVAPTLEDENGEPAKKPKGPKNKRES